MIQPRGAKEKKGIATDCWRGRRTCWRVLAWALSTLPWTARVVLAWSASRDATAVIGDDVANAGTAGEAVNRPSTNKLLLAIRAMTVLWSLRFMRNVLLWVFGVVGNYNTNFRRVKCPLTQLKAYSSQPRRIRPEPP
jgi:hypothetical protein